MYTIRLTEQEETLMSSKETGALRENIRKASSTIRKTGSEGTKSSLMRRL